MIPRVKATVDEDARITIQDIAEALAISSGSVSNIVEDKFRNSKVSARYIPHILTQKKQEGLGRALKISPPNPRPDVTLCGWQDVKI